MANQADNKQTAVVEPKTHREVPVVDEKSNPAKKTASSTTKDFGANQSPRRQTRRLPRRSTRVRPEFDNKIISIRRVTRVVAGGRRFSFSVALVAGDKKGRVGVGQGKAGDTQLAIEKALRMAKKEMIKVSLTKESSIPHEVQVKYSSALVRLMPAPGKGIIAGSAVRTVLELAGIKGVGAKILSRSKNKINIARATVKALALLTTK